MLEARFLLPVSSVRVAIALFEDEVSPRFCHAKSASIYTWNGACAEFFGQAWLGDAPYPDRLNVLASYGVQTLLCGSFPCSHHPAALRLGIRVVCGCSGSAQALASRLGESLAAPPANCDAPEDRTQR